MAMELMMSHSSGDLTEEEARIEELLAEKLQDGYVVLEISCPSCATPLVKNDGDDIPQSSSTGSLSNNMEPKVVPSESFEQPFHPVSGVPFCVACQSHVVTDDSEISILERCDSLKHKGSILIALQGADSSYTNTAAGDKGNAPMMTTIDSEDSNLSLVMEDGEAVSSSNRMMELQEKHSNESGYADEKKCEDFPTPVPASASVHSYEALELTGAEDIMAEYSVR